MWTLDQALLDRPGRKNAAKALLWDYQHNPGRYPEWQSYLRAHQPPLLAIWGANDPFFIPPGAEAYKRDVPGADVVLLDTGHFALVEELDVIAAHVDRFLHRAYDSNATTGVASQPAVRLLTSVRTRERLLGALVTASAPASAAPLPRANIVLPSAKSVDLAANTVMLTLHKGSAKGATVWYVITDASDPTVAAKLGLLYSPLIASAGAAIVQASGTVDALVYPGTVDFSPARVLKTDAMGNPTEAKPGSIGDDDYSPLVRIGSGGPVYNAPIVASGDAPHDLAGHGDVLDRVVAIDTKNPSTATVTLVLARGFTNGQPVAYISTDASVDAPAAIERSTYAPRLKKLSAGAIPIDVFFNGSKQGIPFTALHGRLDAVATTESSASIGSPLNIQATFPAPNNGASGYSPMWSVYPAAWTKAAASSGKEIVVTSNGDVQKLADADLVTSPDGKAFGAAGITVNCPVVAFAEKRP